MECIQLSLFGKTYPEHSVPTAAKISEPCWKNLPESHNQTFQFLDLRVGGADGAKPEQSPETDGLWHGDSSMLNTGESPNAERESLLSWILEDNVPQKYYLSARACQGILTKASRRGKSLPEILRQALLDVIEQAKKSSMNARGNGDSKIAPTVTGDHENRITDYTAIAIERKTFNEQSFSGYKESDKCSTLRAKSGNIGNGSECLIAEKAIRWIVRRLTPVECERLQGFPDNYTNIGDWTDSKGKKHKYADSPRYKALGNSIALPQWFWLVQRMRPYLKEKPTLGSLFDGLGGFPLVWQRAYGEGTARWASEIEEFPMAVTKRRFGEE